MFDYLFYIVFAYYVVLVLIKLKSRPLKLFLYALPLVLIIVFRYGIGADYFSYQYLYDSLDISTIGNFFNSLTRVEIGYRILMMFGRLLHLPYHVFNVLICATIFTLISKWIVDQSDDIGLSYLIYYSLFFFVWNLSALRQALVMSIALCFIFGKKPLALKYQIILIIGLSTVHASALVLLVYIFIDKLNLNLKKHVIILAACCLITVIPLYKIVSLLPSGLPLINSVTVYLENGINPFWNVQGLLRLVMVLPLFLIYSQYSSISSFHKKQIDTAIFGFSLYFLLRFSELSAARLLVYTLIFCVVIYANGISILSKKWMKISGKLLIVAFCSLFLIKEIVALEDQTGLSSSNRFGIPLTTVFNADAKSFNNPYAYLLAIRADRELQYESYYNESMKMRIDESKDLNEHMDIDLISVRFPNGLYGLIDEQGNIVRTAQFEYSPVTFHNIYEQIDTNINFRSYWALNGIHLSYNDAQGVIDQSIKEKQSVVSQTMSFEFIEKESLSEEILSLFEYQDQLQAYDVTTVEAPFKYKVYRLAYFKYYVYVYVDENDKLIIRDYFNEKNYYDEIGMLTISNGYYTSVIDKFGNVLWMQ